MRPIRWKSNFSVPQPEVDQRLRRLVEALNEVAREAGGVEHCGDLPELHGRIQETVTALLRSGAADSSALDRLGNDLQSILAQGLPLPARDGPACTDCGMCDRLAERVQDWLESAHQAPQAQAKRSARRTGCVPAPRA